MEESKQRGWWGAGNRVCGSEPWRYPGTPLDPEPRDRLTRDSAGDRQSPLEGRAKRIGRGGRRRDWRWEAAMAAAAGRRASLRKRVGFGLHFRKSMFGSEELAC